MRKLIIFIMLVSLTANAQETFRKGEVIVKFKDIPESTLNVAPSTTKRAAQKEQQPLDALLQQIGATEVKPLMPLTGKNAQTARRKLASNQEVAKDLSQLCVLKFDSAHAVKDVIAQLQSLDNVEYAEPNYLVKACADYSSEPRYGDQWGLRAIKMPELWQVPVKNTRRPVIAILDTGVETTHPDLAANIWHNEDETADGNDSDENGYADDICGWNFIGNNADVKDDNGHGTHCAGIAAAIGDNNEGICGANPDALIMPVKVLDEYGIGSVDLIIQGILYAATNGADIISMSLTVICYEASTYEALEDALSIAYSSAILIAAAGNDHVCMVPSHEKYHGNNECFAGLQPRYPAASKYVLGVMATDESGQLASFSNFDCDGPLRARDPGYYDADFEDNKSYELKAPGDNILSTYIGGGYTYLSGTSMACPMAAGAISRLLQCRDYTHEELLKALVHTSGNNIDMMAAYQVTDEALSETTFSIEHNGVSMVFVKTSEGTCQLGDGEQPAIDVNTQGVVEIPEEVHGLSVSGIASNAFKGCQYVTEIIVPLNVLGFGLETFKGCTSLTRLALMGFTQGFYDFYDDFDEATYKNCTLCVNDGDADYYRESQWKIFEHQEYFPYNLGRVFFADVNGTSFPFTVTSLSPKTVKCGFLFHHDALYSIESFDVPSEIQGYAVTAVSECAFADSPNLISVTLPPTIESLGSGAFVYCHNLQHINIPDGVKTLDDHVFEYCSSLSSIDLPSSVEYIGGQAFTESGISSFTFPEKVTTIEHHLFCLCKNLKHIEIPSQIKRIEYDAFHGSGLETVVIGSGVEYIAEFAFYGCNSLKQIEVKATTPPTFVYLSTFPDYTIPLIVPKGCKEIYQTAINWELFTNIIEADEPEVVPGDANGDGTVDASDLTALVSILLGHSVGSMNADVNADGATTIADIVALIAILAAQ